MIKANDNILVTAICFRESRHLPPMLPILYYLVFLFEIYLIIILIKLGTEIMKFILSVNLHICSYFVKFVSYKVRTKQKPQFITSHYIYKMKIQFKYST